MQTTWKVLVAVTVMASGCATPLSARMQAVATPVSTAPDTAQATIVFLRPGGGGANAVLDETGQNLGEMPKGSKLVVRVSPGPHLFVKTVLKDPGKGDFSIFSPGDITCHALTGTFEGNKIYFVEASLFRLFAVKGDDANLSAWAALPAYQLDPARAASATSASDPGWATCVEAAKKNLAGYKDQKSIIGPEHALASWPH